MQAKFDRDMAVAEQKTEELLGTAADESYVAKPFFVVLRLFRFGPFCMHD